jgi:cobalt/nickel transport system ATP-binding protein
MNYGLRQAYNRLAKLGDPLAEASILLDYRWADQVLLIEDGRLLHQGPPAEVFVNQDLVTRARMKLPAVMEICQELRGRGVLNGDRPPKNVLELTDILETRTLGSFSRERPGNICIYNVDCASSTEIKSFLVSGRTEFVGAMGTSAKMLAEREKIVLDFTYGVIDKCILKAITGHNSLIITSGGMVEHELRRINGYASESGVEIVATLLSSNQEK